LSGKVAIVGQGVMGLTSAVRLRESGFRVTLFSREPFGQTTSMAAGAYWGPHKTYPAERVLDWAKTTYDEYSRQRRDPQSGVHFEPHLRFCVDPDDNAFVLQCVDDWERIDAEQYGVSCHEAFRAILPVIDVPVFMRNLKRRLEEAHADFVLDEIESPGELACDYDLVVNCTGVWARHFVEDDEVFPIRGQVVRVTRPAELGCSTRIYLKDDRLTLILPRSNDVILGGTSQENDWDRGVRSSESENILKQCTEVVPDIREAEVLGAAVGLRPGRRAVRLELEITDAGQAVIHNYGHGGGGYTVAWGCADEVAAIARRYCAAADNSC